MSMGGMISKRVLCNVAQFTSTSLGVTFATLVLHKSNWNCTSKNGLEI